MGGKTCYRVSKAAETAAGGPGGGYTDPDRDAGFGKLYGTIGNLSVLAILWGLITQQWWKVYAGVGVFIFLAVAILVIFTLMKCISDHEDDETDRLKWIQFLPGLWDASKALLCVMWKVASLKYWR